MVQTYYTIESVALSLSS